MEQNDVNPLVDQTREALPVSIWRSFLTIWIHPRKTILQVIENFPNSFTVPGIILWGICVTDLPGQIASGSISFGSITFILALCAVLFYLANIVAWVGNKLGGSANSNLTRTAIVWALVPYITMTLLSKFINLVSDITIVNFFFFGLIFVSIGWSLVLAPICVAVVQKIPIWKAVISLLIGSAVSILVFYLYFFVTTTSIMP